MKVDDHPISVVIDSGATASLITKKLMKKLGYIIDQSSKLVIIAVNGEKTRALGEIMDFPLKVKGIHFTHNIQVIDFSDEILILGNDWLTKVNANLDWKERTLMLWKSNRMVSIPVQLTKSYISKTNEDFSDEIDKSDESEEYESENLEEFPVYYSDFSDEYSVNELEFNPWVDHVFEKEIIPEDDESEGEDNLAVYITSVVNDEEVPPLNLGPLDSH